MSKPLYLYLIARPDWDYDELDSVIMASESEEKARYTFPDSDWVFSKEVDDWVRNKEALGFSNEPSWHHPKELSVMKIGIADKGFEEGAVVLGSFNAG